MTISTRYPWEIRMPWRDRSLYEGTPLWTPAASRLSGSYGVYELADEEKRVVYVGYAGSRARFGLRGKILAHFSDEETNPEIRRAQYFRYEVTSSYLSRWAEIIARHKQLADMPPGNQFDKSYPRRMPYFGPLRVPSE